MTLNICATSFPLVQSFHDCFLRLLGHIWPENVQMPLCHHKHVGDKYKGCFLDNPGEINRKIDPFYLFIVFPSKKTTKYLGIGDPQTGRAEDLHGESPIQRF